MNAAIEKTSFQDAPLMPPLSSITVSIKSVYGVDKIYPACPKAEVFCKLLNQKTLTDRDIDLIKKLGIAIRVDNNLPVSL
jgi:hypothetical protein